MSEVQITSPLTGATLHEIAKHSQLDVELAFSKAAIAQKFWARQSISQRSKVLFRYHDFILREQDALMDLLQAETGKSRNHAFEEIAGSLSGIRYQAQAAKKALRSHRVKSGVPGLLKTYVEYQPVGVVGVITPWNYPLALTMLDVMPALVAGNAVIQKADNQTAKSIAMARDLALQAGLPEDIWQLVHGDASEVGNAVVDNADYVAFTGSTATGKIVAQRAASRLIGYSLELGGKNPMIILPSANLETAAEKLIAASFSNSGQLCVAIERAYLPKEKLVEFEAILSKKLDSMLFGTTGQFDTDMGSLVSKSQLHRVQGFVDRARAAGAQIRMSENSTNSENFFAPTIVTGLAADAEMVTSEVFGPVVALLGYDSTEQAVRLANESDYGLNASVLGNVAEAKKIASQLMAGTVNINEGYRATMASLDAPMGGMKQSGVGRRNGIGGIRRFTEPRAVGIASGPLSLPSRGFEYKKMAPMMTAVAKIMKRL